MSNFKAMKFRVSSPSESFLIQQGLFKLGYKWLRGGKISRHTNALFLYSFVDGELGYGYDACYYNTSDHQECIVEVSIKPAPKKLTLREIEEIIGQPIEIVEFTQHEE